jgi:nucleotide-binding universal stress UspA family protein
VRAPRAQWRYPFAEIAMTYRSLLVHVDTSARSDHRVVVAARLAQAFNAELAGAYLVPGGELSPFASAMLPADLVAARLLQAGDAQADAETRFRTLCGDNGLMAVEWRAPAGDPLDAAVMHARYADLTVLGQPAPEDAQSGFASELANAVLLQSGRPVLFVPFTAEDVSPGRTILVALKDTRESARALADALPLLARAQSVVVMTVSPDANVAVGDALVEKRVLAWLETHEIEAMFRREVAPDLDAGNVLLSQAADLGADLIVMGAYSRPRVTELVLGGVTRLMLSSMTVPVLMAH